MQLPKRKPLRLVGYDYSQSGAYFITLCTNKRAQIFDVPRYEELPELMVFEPDYENKNKPLSDKLPYTSYNMVLKWLYKIEDKFPDIWLDCCSIMENHIHLILVNLSQADTGTSVADVVQWFKTQTTNEYIRAVKSGLFKPYNKHLWQRSYYDHIIRNEEDLNMCRRYIEENPLLDHTKE